MKTGLLSGGLLLLAVALLPPLAHWAEESLAAHMAQHMLLALFAPMLLVLAQPLPGLLRALGCSRRWRRRITRFTGTLSRPLPAALLFGATLWLWHAPAAYELALHYEAVHWLEHLSLLAGGLAFAQMLRTAARTQRQGEGLLLLMLTALHLKFLGALLLFAPRPLYAVYAQPLWGLTALEDQQLAALVMLAPMMPVFITVGLVLVAGWLKQRPRWSHVPP